MGLESLGKKLAQLGNDTRSSVRKMNESYQIGNKIAEEKKTLRGVYRCRVCGYIFDESLEGKPFSTLEKCPICKQGPGAFQQVR